MTAEILAIGSELLTPQRVDTNSLYLTQKLNEIGVEVAGKAIVGDDRARLALAIQQARARAEIVILSGGLGPTEDDVTRDAVASACGRELVFHQEVLEAIEARFQSLRRAMAPINRRQAYILDGAEILPNDRGTAPGQWYRDQAGVLILLPGPPNELKAMFEKQCLPRLRDVVPPQHIFTRVLRIAGMPESDVDQLIAPIYTRYTNPVTTILAAPSDIQVHFRGHGSSDSEARVVVEELARQVEAVLGDRIYSRQGESLEEVVGRLLGERGATLAAAESCTGGLLAERITSVPGSSKYFVGGWVTYSNRVKAEWLGVSAATLEAQGAVSAEAAREMAQGARRAAGSTLAVAITGVAGPTPDSGGGQAGPKPVGLVYLALADAGGCSVKERQFVGERDRIRWQASQLALDLIRRKFLA
ncbi:MAG TPA: competence/damage-inducible protein A [Bryobacterales bacterium]|nr:competence/damage-inducible protein A [Bryobacterales bacterium]